MALKITILAALLAAASASILPASQPLIQTAPLAVPITKTVVAEPYDPNPQYSYGYEVQDPLTGDSHGQVESRSGDVVRGSYALLDSDGTRRVVEYTADPVNGFNAVVSKQPVARVVAPQPLTAIPAAPVALARQPIAAIPAAPVAVAPQPLAAIPAARIAVASQPLATLQPAPVALPTLRAAPVALAPQPIVRTVAAPMLSAPVGSGPWASGPIARTAPVVTADPWAVPIQAAEPWAAAGPWAAAPVASAGPWAAPAVRAGPWAAPAPLW